MIRRASLRWRLVAWVVAVMLVVRALHSVSSSGLLVDLRRYLRGQPPRPVGVARTAWP